MSSPARAPPPQTPSAAPKIKPPMSEMHPSKAHPTMAAPSSALRLGFTDIKAVKTTTPGLRAQQTTPSKCTLPSSPFDFQIVRNANNPDSTLGPEAQRMMNELREEAAKIKADLVAKRDKERQDEQLLAARKIAHPKGKAGRYSDLHMAEFKKMDSIENHPSSFRATPGRFTPVSSSKQKNLKRTQSKANLDDETPQTKTQGRPTSSKSSTKMSTPGEAAHAPSKRAKQQADDDATTNRPVSRDETNIPRPKTPGKDIRGIPRTKTFGHLLSPTQASLARTAIAAKTPTAPRSILKSPSKVTLAGLNKSATASNLDATGTDADAGPAKLQTPSRFDKVKSIFAKHKKTPATAAKPSIPKPAAGLSKTPAPHRTQTELPAAGSFTTPGKKVARRVDFTPAPKHAALAQNSPSPVKTGTPRSKATNSLANYPSLEPATDGFTSTAGDNVMYPDLSGAGSLDPVDAQEANAVDTEEDSSDKTEKLPVAVPGHFTFRSDHTIRFGSSSPRGFGGHSGQASVRYVRPSIVPPMPGAFPATNAPQTAAPQGKENVAPYHDQGDQAFNGKTFPHGVGTKKRYRVEDDEEEAEREAAERAVKKQKSAAVPEGEALMAPRLTGTQRGNGIRSPSKIFKRSPTKSRIPTAPTTTGGRKVTGISMSRLAYLAQPKQRK